jgi:DNA ligase 1
VRAFSRLFRELDVTTSTNDKVVALERYFRTAPAADSAWAVFLLTGRTIRRPINRTQLRQLLGDITGLPAWLIDECYDPVGDFAELVALLIGAPGSRTSEVDIPLHRVLVELSSLSVEDVSTQCSTVRSYWARLSEQEIFIFTKLLTGGFRVGVSATLVTRALASVSGAAPATIAHRLMGSWEPSAAWFGRLMSPEEQDADRSRPYPFFLAVPLEQPADSLGNRDEWQVEWKWDGIRGQLVRRSGAIWLWSRGEELVTDRYPEVAESAHLLPEGVVLDGELLAWRDGVPLPFGALQRRIGRKAVSRRMLADVPVVFVAFDLLEAKGIDLRQSPLHERRARLEDMLAPAASHLRLSPLIEGDWNELARARGEARNRNVEGLMLKRRSSAYGVGRRVGDWWKWKIEPHTMDAVMMYAQSGHGKRATLHTDYTFGVWDEGALVPVAKAYTGLDDDEIRRLDRWIRTHTVERFGPVRHVEPLMVFELAFEAIARSGRHKSGIAVRFPRILRWRSDMAPENANTLESLRRLVEAR